MAERESDQEEWERKNREKVEAAREHRERTEGMPEHIRENMEQNKQEPQVPQEQPS